MMSSRRLLSLVAAILVATLLPLESAVRADEGATISASLDITVYACPDGVDPTGDATACTAVVDAAPGAMLGAAPDMRMPLSSAERTPEGAYTFAWSVAPGDGSVGLGGFAPTDYNYFTFRGLDESHRWGGGVDLSTRAHRSVSVYYYNGNEPLITPGENTMTVSVLDCPAGVDPTADASACANPVPSAELSSLEYSIDSTLGYAAGGFADRSREADGTYSFTALGVYSKFSVHDTGQDDSTYIVTGDIEEQREDLGGGTAYLVRGESRQITVYRVGAAGGGDLPQHQTGTLIVSLRSCPPSVTSATQVSPDACPTSLQDDGSARLQQGAKGVYEVLTTFSYQHGSYVRSDIAAGSWTIFGLAPVTRDSLVVTGADDYGDGRYGFAITPGDTTEITVYYLGAES